ncbi:MAG: hypothetical protein H7251_03165 [Acetobacteraceae bacterium]|nr:hypothetical protein [Acetobacteraceae bacterium]
MEIVRIAVIVALPLLTGCTLVDQRTFYPPAKPAAGQLAEAGRQTRPDLIIRLGAREPDWHPAIAALVEQSLARRPDARFEIIAAVGANGAALEQTRAARDVAQAMGALGVPASRLLLGLHTDDAGDVRIFVR